MFKSKNFKYYLAVFISLMTFAVYLRALQNDFVILDDNAYVYENLHIRSFNMAFLRWAFLNFYASNWHPLTWISHALDYAVWGLNPVGHHLTNVILHTANTFIVVLLAMRLLDAWAGSTGQKKAAAFTEERSILIAGGVTGILFGLHPLHVESVAWVSERKDLLCALFFLLSVMSYAKYTLSVSRESRGGERIGEKPVWRLAFFSNRHYLAAGGWFILALLSKPMAVTLPVVFLILDWYPFNRIHSLKTFRFVFAEKLPLLGLSLISSILTMYAQGSGHAIIPITFVPLSIRLLVATKSLAVYLWKMVVPLNLVPFYPYPENASLLTGEYLLSIVFVIAITATCLVMAKKHKLSLSCWSYYVVTLVPVIGIVQVGGQAMADRYTYLPSLGPFFITGCAVAWLVKHVNASQKRWMPAVSAIGLAAIALAFLLMGYLTFRQCGVWKNSLVVLNYILEKKPHNSPHVYLYRGMVFEKAGRPQSALQDYNQAIALDPSYADAYSARGTLYQKEGRTDRAMDDFNKSILLNPSSANAYFGKGVISAETGFFDQAIMDFTRSLTVDPAFANAYTNRGIAYAMMGRQDLALADFNRAIELNTRSPDAYFNRGKLYYSIGRKESALADFQDACDLGDAGGCSALKDLGRDFAIPGK
jgi:tetratricopeptide (TPR) repeat protein